MAKSDFAGSLLVYLALTVCNALALLGRTFHRLGFEAETLFVYTISCVISRTVAFLYLDATATADNLNFVTSTAGYKKYGKHEHKKAMS
jgi:hypothetical protein